MASLFRNQELRFSAESTFLENANSPGSNTFTTSIHTFGIPLFNPPQPRIDDGGIVVRQNERRPGWRGTRDGGTLEFTVPAFGHSAQTATGSLAETWLYTLLTKGLGGGSSGDTGSTVSSGTDANTFLTVANPADLTVGGLFRLGTKGDGRGNGQCGAVASVSGQTVDCLTGFAGTPSAADIVYAMLQVHVTNGFTDNLSSTRTMRFLVAHPDTGAQWQALGCQLEGLSLSWGVAALPMLTFRYRVGYWTRAAETTPSAVAVSVLDASPVSDGDVFFQTTALSTRQVLKAHSMSLQMNLGLVPMPATSGLAPYSTISGWHRGRVEVDVTFRLQTWDSAYETLWDSDGSSSTHYQILFQNSTSDGRVFAGYLPRTFINGPRPTREDVDTLNGVSFTMSAREGSTTTSEQTRSLIRFGIG